MRMGKLCPWSFWDMDRENRRHLGEMLVSNLQALPSLEAAAFSRGKRGVLVEKYFQQ